MIPQVSPRGRLSAPYLVVLGKPNKWEADKRRVGEGKAFALAVHLLETAGVKQQDCLFVPAVSRKKDADWTPDEVRADAQTHIAPLTPGKKVIAFGNTAACAIGAIQELEGANKLFGRAVPCASGQAVLTMDPFVIAQSPRNLPAARRHLHFGLKSLSGWVPRFPDIEVRLLDTVEAAECMAHDILTNPELPHRYAAYDYETTLLNERKARIVTGSYANGTVNKQNEYISWLWAPFDALVPRFAADQKRKIEDVLIRLSDELKIAYYQKDRFGGRVAHNRRYDDYVEFMNYGDRMAKPHWSAWDTKIMYWQYDSLTSNGLKDMFEVFFGLPDYDKVITDEVSKVVARRSRARHISDPVDFEALRWIGKEPELCENGKHKWPEKVPSKDTAYAVLPLELLGYYNCQDTVATWLSFIELYNWLDNENLLETCREKHKHAIRLHEATMHGLMTDEAVNRDMSRVLNEIATQADAQVRRTLGGAGYDQEFIDKFNANSPLEVRKVLYGEPVSVPILDPKKHTEALVEKFGGLKKAAKVIDEQFAGIWAKPAFKEAAKNKCLDIEQVRQEAVVLCTKAFDIPTPQFKETKVYPGALCRPRAFTKTGLPAIGKTILEAHIGNEEESEAKEFLKAYLLRMKVKKLLGTFVDGVYSKLENGFCYPTYNEIGTISGRSSSSNPNGQNYVGKLRGQHIPLPGHSFFEFDFSQAEIKVAAALSNDPVLIEHIASGKDLHTLTAMMMYNLTSEEEVSKVQRKSAKTINFGVIYGMSSMRLALALGITVEEAEQLIEERYFGAYKRLKEWIEEMKVKAAQPPYYVQTPMGTRISTLDTLSMNMDNRSHAERVSVNAPVQGGAGEYAFWTIDKLCERIESNGWWTEEGTNGFCNTVHDSAVIMTWDKLRLAWIAGEKITSTGERKQVVEGPLVEELQSVLRLPAPWHPLERVPMSVDIEINQHWSGRPNVMLACDPAFGTDKAALAWDLIDLSRLDKEEREEIEQLERTGVLCA